MYLRILHIALKVFFSAVDKATSNSNECPPVKYTAYAFYINTERNIWKMHFNVTKALDALIQVRLYAPGLLYIAYKLIFLAASQEGA